VGFQGDLARVCTVPKTVESGRFHCPCW